MVSAPGKKSRRKWRPLAEALGFTAGVLLVEWFRPAWWTYLALGALALAMAAAFSARRETLSSVGFGTAALRRSLISWRYGYLACVAALIFAEGERLLLPAELYRGGVYLVWSVIQQLAYQNMVCKPVRRTRIPSPAGCAVAGILFSAVHLPNPVLAPATLVWGTASCHLFTRIPSVPGLALLQTLLSSILYRVTPIAWHRGFRVGAGYFLRR